MWIFSRFFQLFNLFHLWVVVLTTTITWLVAKAAVIAPPPAVDASWDCVPCSLAKCVDQTNCPGGTTMDHCGCCTICLKTKGEPCGGLSYRKGRCARSLYCNITGPYRSDPIGHCAPYRNTIQRQVIPTTVPTTSPTTLRTLLNTVPSNPIKTTLATYTVGAEDESNLEVASKKDEIPSLSDTGSPHANSTGGFVKGTGKNIGINKDSETPDESTIDTMPALMFVATSGIIMSLLVVLVACFDKRTAKQ